MSTLDIPDHVDPIPSATTAAHVVYALHTFAIVIGIVGSASIVGSFVASVPSIIAVILNYAKRADARGTWVESHYRWQIRTFWFALLWVAVSLVFIATIVGVVIAAPMLLALAAWLIYRIARGWLRLRDRRPMYV